MRIQRFLGVTRLALLALAHPINFAQWSEYTRSMIEAVPVQYASRARARRYSVGRCERVGSGRRHRVLKRVRQTVGGLLTLMWIHTALRVCLVGAGV
jgi:hypothetical protein